MSEISHLTRAGVRRLATLHPVGRRLQLRGTLLELAGSLPRAQVEERLAAYALDPCGGPLVARGLADEQWFHDSLILRAIAPGSALPIADDLAAIVAAPRLVADGALAERALAHRFASRADDALAAAVGLLAPDGALAAIGALAAAPGPDEDRLHLALLQAGGCLAWRPDLHDDEAAGALALRLVGLLDRANPSPLLDTLAPILGAIAAGPSTLARRVREAVHARLDEMRTRIVDRRSGASFLDEFRALDRTRALPDEDYYMTLPDRRVAEAAARILGRSAEGLGDDRFASLQAEVLAGELGSSLLPSFVDGVIGAAAIAPLAELATHLLASADEEPRSLGLHMAAQLPLDACTDAVIACLDDSRKRIRARATRAVMLLEPARAVAALEARLDDPEPEVCAAAARALVALGQRDRVDARRMPGELAVGKTRERTAAARAALGEPAPDVVEALLPLCAAEAGREDPEAPMIAALGWVFLGSPDGIRIGATLVQEIPDALPFLALALAGDDGPVALPRELRAELAAVLEPLIAAGGETGMLALETLARFSLGDAALIERIVDAGAATEGYGQQILSALASVRRRSARAADALAPWLDSQEHLAATILAAGVAGVALPDGHRLWAQVRALSGLGSIAAAAAYAALVSGVRVRCEDSI